MNRTYSIDLSAQMAACDGNYIRLLKLLPRLLQGEGREIAISAAGEERQKERTVFVLEVVETFRYTSTVRISQKRPRPASEVYLPPEMLVRLYHDANTAEVIAYQQQCWFRAVYPLPDGRMYHPGEKDQLNRFLTEWLNLCLQRGVSAHDVLEDCLV